MLLRVTLHDNLGNEFSHNFDDLNPLVHKLSRKEIVDVSVSENFSLALNLVRETPNMIGITLKDTNGIKYAEDIIKLAVGPSKYVYPTEVSIEEVFVIVICYLLTILYILFSDTILGW